MFLSWANTNDYSINTNNREVFFDRFLHEQACIAHFLSVCYCYIVLYYY